MRRLFCGLVAVTVGLGAGLAAQVRQAQDQAAQRAVDDMARKMAEEYARRSALALGRLSADGIRAISRWDIAVQRWKKEKGAGARPLLAEGVLLDCLSRFHGVGTMLLSSEERDPRALSVDLSDRPVRAAKAFEKALKVDPTLTEARFRQARIRAAKDPQARRELETLGTESFGVILARGTRLTDAVNSATPQLPTPN